LHCHCLGIDPLPPPRVPAGDTDSQLTKVTSAGLDDLVGDTDDIQMPMKQKRKPIKKKFDCLVQRLEYQIMMMMNFET
jgi:hypothetical protein